MYRMANFPISKSLEKAEKMPNYRQWKVSENDKSVEGSILLYIRAKGWFFDRVCQPGLRYCVLTKRGFLLIYMRNEKGFVLDMRRAVEIKTISDNVSVLKSEYRRCRVKIRYTFGTVNIILTNGKIDLWRDRLLNSTASPSTMAVTRQLALPPLDSDYNVACTPYPRPASSMYGPIDNIETSRALTSFSTCHSDNEASTKENWAKVKTPDSKTSDTSVVTAVDVSTCDDDYQCLSSRLAQIDEEESSVVAESSTSGLFNYDSIRESKIPVGWLRRQVEHKMDSKRRHPIFVATPSTPILTSESSPPIAPSDLPIVTKTEEMPHLPLSVTLDKSAVSKTTKSKKQVKFSIKRKSPVKANVKSMPSDSSNCDNTRFNSFQFWRSSILESDV
ncbi:hypothetical protein PRIPAC_73873 [Pristionchus pacificus]|uniref:DUF7778 domain-containing protein n=1 Tax=Pristionchus pacificus TaxID=54126 RepID=A0A2A6BFL1_PRIPA|nr:hypothetical protein PRIPAC_73873 [Pristionchus pacificus]|eukprot:PDM64669.1 hypothetical protein PRIPAC_52925 [Pristionchus pacificus]